MNANGQLRMQKERLAAMRSVTAHYTCRFEDSSTGVSIKVTTPEY
jgi:hypothetical protein